MNEGAVCCSTISANKVDAVDPMAGSKIDDSFEEISCNGEVLRELGNAREAITRVELDIACSSEKLVNLNMLMMHVVQKECDFEAFVSEPDQELDISVERALEFNLLSGILDSEAAEFNGYVTDIQSEIVSARKIIYPGGNLGESFAEMDEKLRDFEESLNQSLNQISEMMLQSAEFQKTLCYCEKNNGNGDQNADVFRNGHVYMKIKMQTADQQRLVLRMLEKSLARELDLEKKLTDSRLVEDELKVKLSSSEQGMFCAEEDMETSWMKYFESDCVTAILREKIKELINDAEAAKTDYQVLLEDTCSLNQEMKRLQENEGSSRLDLLEKRLTECENLVEDVRLKVVKTEMRAKDVEEKSITLLESNVGLGEEVGFLRNKLKSLEKCLGQVEEKKISSAKGIDFRTRIIRGLVMQIAIEREGLYKQISWLMEKNCLGNKSKDSYEREGTTKSEVGIEESEAISNVRVIDVSLLNSKHLFITFLMLLLAMALLFLWNPPS